MAFIEVRDVTKTYKMGEVEIKAVDEIGFGIDRHEVKLLKDAKIQVDKSEIEALKGIE